MSLNDSQKWMLLAGIAGLGFLLYLLSPILAPFIAGALLAYLGDPLVDRLEERKLSRTLSVSIVFVVLFTLLTLLVLLLVPLLEQQLRYLIQSVPGYLDRLQTEILPALAHRLGIPADDTLLLDALRKTLNANSQQAGGIALMLAKSISQSGASLVAGLATLVLIPVVTFYLLRDWDLLVARVDELLPRQYEPLIARLAKQSDEVLAAFLRGQFLVMLALGVIYSAGLWFAGVKLAILIGMLAGLVSFVPYLGFIVGILAASLAVLLQTGDISQLLPVAIVFGVGQAIEGMLLTPLLVGDRIGLHPVAVIFSVLAGGQLFGFVGVLLALPVAAVIAVVLRHVHQRYLDSHFFKHTDDD